jgi:hypothetical protein
VVYKLNKKKRKQNTNAKKENSEIYFSLFCFVCVYHTGTRESIKDRKKMSALYTHIHTHTHGRASIRRRKKDMV